MLRWVIYWWCWLPPSVWHTQLGSEDIGVWGVWMWWGEGDQALQVGGKNSGSDWHCLWHHYCSPSSSESHHLEHSIGGLRHCWGTPPPPPPPDTPLSSSLTFLRQITVFLNYGMLVLAPPLKLVWRPSDPRCGQPGHPWSVSTKGIRSGRCWPGVTWLALAVGWLVWCASVGGWYRCSLQQINSALCSLLQMMVFVP